MIRSAHWPARPAPPAAALTVRRPVHTVLLCADGHDDSRPAVERAIERAARDHARLVALLVLPADDPAPVRDGDGPMPAHLNRLVEQARAAGVAATCLIHFGDPGETILRSARDVDADLIIVCGGPLSGYVARRSGRPVLVVQPWGRRAGES